MSFSKNYKTYELQTIKFIKKSISLNSKVTYWAKVDQAIKRISQEYFFLLKVQGIKIVSLNSTIQKVKCLAITRQGFQCSRSVLTNKKYCFQHLQFDNTENKLKNLSTKSIFSYKKKKKITFIDLFCGAGGLSAGLIQAGLNPLFCIDKDLDSCTTLKANYKNVKVINKSVEAFNFLKFRNKVDIIVGGSPCQSFSQIGLRKGLLDSNGIALLNFIKIIFCVLPKVFIIENVKGLLSHNKGITLDYILSLLSKDNIYDIETKLISMVDYGVPQKRIRFFIIGSLKSLKLSFFPLPSLYEKQTLEDVLINTPNSKGMEYSLKKKELFKNIPEGGCWINLPLEIQKSYLGKSFKSTGGKRGILRRLSMKEPCLTLLCSPSQKQTERCHPLYDRPLTIREYARIQTFPDNYLFSGNISSQYRQIGNSVPVLFSYQLGIHLLNLFNKL